MSAFLVSPSTLAIVTVAIHRDKLRAGDLHCAGAQMKFVKHHIRVADQLELAATLYDMNVYALKQRYPDSWEPMVYWQLQDADDDSAAASESVCHDQGNGQLDLSAQRGRRSRVPSV